MKTIQRSKLHPNVLYIGNYGRWIGMATRLSSKSWLVQPFPPTDASVDDLDSASTREATSHSLREAFGWLTSI